MVEICQNLAGQFALTFPAKTLGLELPQVLD